MILKSRNNKDWTSDLQPIADAVNQLPFEQIILDGEVTVLDAEGRSDFQLLQNSLQNKSRLHLSISFLICFILMAMTYVDLPYWSVKQF